MQAEVAFAAVEHDEMLFQIHRTAGEHAGPRRHQQGLQVFAFLYLVEEAAGLVAADHALKLQARECGVERVAHAVRHDEDVPQSVDRDGVGQFDPVLLHRPPDLIRGELGRLGGVE